jgi:hypothetical protein
MAHRYLWCRPDLHLFGIIVAARCEHERLILSDTLAVQVISPPKAGAQICGPIYGCPQLSARQRANSVAHLFTENEFIYASGPRKIHRGLRMCV